MPVEENSHGNKKTGESNRLTRRPRQIDRQTGDSSRGQPGKRPEYRQVAAGSEGIVRVGRIVWLPLGLGDVVEIELMFCYSSSKLKSGGRVLILKPPPAVNKHHRSPQIRCRVAFFGQSLCLSLQRFNEVPHSLHASRKSIAAPKVAKRSIQCPSAAKGRCRSLSYAGIKL